MFSQNIHLPFTPAAESQGLEPPPQTREIFKGFRVMKVKARYAGGAYTGKSKAVTELLISNLRGENKH